VVNKVSENIKRFAPGAIVIVVTNPLDIMTYVALQTTGFSVKKIIGMGSGLDSSRLANLLAKHLNFSVNNIQPVVFGAHGKQMLVSDRTSLNRVGIREVLDSKKFAEIKRDTVNRGARLVSLFKKGSARFAPAAACVELIKAITDDERKCSFASVYLQGEYGLKDVCMGVPVIIGKAGIEQVLNLKLKKKELDLLKEAKKTFCRYKKLV